MALVCVQHYCGLSLRLSQQASGVRIVHMDPVLCSSRVASAASHAIGGGTRVAMRAVLVGKG